MQAEAEVVQIDIYSNERAGLIEQLGILTGGTTWREVFRGSHSTADNMPQAHKLAAALAYARETDPSNIGPDILEAMATGTQVHRRRIVGELTAALRIGTGRLAARNMDHLLQIAADAFLACVGVLPKGRPQAVSARDYNALTALGERILWRAADEALTALARKLR